MNKYKLFMIISICILTITIGTSLALFVWESETNAIVNLNVCTPTVYFSGGEVINGNNIVPVMNREDAAKKEIDVYLNNNCGNIVLMNLYMRLDVLSSGLSDETFVYELYKNNELVGNGNFADKKEGDIVELTTNEEISSESSTYFLYVYLDGNQSNPDTTQNQIFSFSLYSEGTGAIYKENVIKGFTVKNDPNSSFLDTAVLRKEIQTITIAKDNNVPEGASSVDISSVGDGSVMMWYTDVDNNNLYEVYIGGKNGIVKANANGQGMFSNLVNVTSIDLTNLDTSELISTRSMFYGCTNLVSLNLGDFDTSKVTDMTSMFVDCSSLLSIDLTNFNTSNVRAMQSMFSGCSKLKDLNLSSFNTSNVTTMRTMFQNCSSLSSINLSSFDTFNVKDMAYMFRGCSSFKNLDLSNFNTANVKDMNYMFFICSNLESLDFSNADTSKVVAMKEMFSGCSKLMSLNLKKADFSNVTNYSDIFGAVSKSATIYVKDSVQKEWITSKYPGFTNVIY